MLIRGKRARWHWQEASMWMLVVVVLFLTLTLCVGCAPTRRPLDERPSEELAWQAWLLVDTSHSNESDRRITPKSVFIAPKLGAGGGGGRTSNLPDCAEGYRPDSMGRCIKFVKVDEAAHLDFLLHRLNAMYASTTARVQQPQQQSPPPEPLQLNIPLGDDETDGEATEPSPDIAIIVAPTSDLGKLKRTPDNWHSQVERPLLQSPSEPVESVMTTTAQTTTLMEELPTTTTDILTTDNQEYWTETARTVEYETTSPAETTTDVPQALFFLISTNSSRSSTESVAPPVHQNTAESRERLTSDQIRQLFQQYMLEVTPRAVPESGISHRSRDRSQDFWRPVGGGRRAEPFEPAEPAGLAGPGGGPQQPMVLRFGRYSNLRPDLYHASPSSGFYQERPRPDVFEPRGHRQAWSFS